ncbi:HEPN domain-containing protein [Shinella zoogloeoides]|uniref:HEPN domain-containing protein n=1 Tax=Shinella zoogloeoides TaxID=352475 RepID=UPI0013C2A77C|nr:HEPN domain-containing protein [Shinella zoogloeoides]
MSSIPERDPVRFCVNLGAYLTRTISDDFWETIDPAHICAWKAATKILQNRTFILEDDNIDISVNWMPVIDRISAHYKVTSDLYRPENKDRLSEVVQGFSTEIVSVEFSASSNLNFDKNKTFNRLYHFIEYYLYDVFLVMNIASPSSANFYSTYIFDKNISSPKNMSLSTGLFETSLMESLDGKWPEIKFIDLELVSNWYHSVRSELKLIPSSKVEKMLFSLLFLASSPVSPTNVVWIFYALEALFDCKVGENFRILVSRIELLLKPTANESSYLRKRMREIYDLRSSFVHGGLEIVHPMENEIIDKSIDSSYMRLMRATDFGFQIILASVQAIISEGWREPIFQETLSGIK